MRRFLGHSFFELYFTYSKYFIWHKIYLSCTCYMQHTDSGNAKKKKHCLFLRSLHFNEDRHKQTIPTWYQATLRVEEGKEGGKQEHRKNPILSLGPGLGVTELLLERWMIESVTWDDREGNCDRQALQARRMVSVSLQD